MADYVIDVYVHGEGKESSKKSTIMEDIASDELKQLKLKQASGKGLTTEQRAVVNATLAGAAKYKAISKLAGVAAAVLGTKLFIQPAKATISGMRGYSLAVAAAYEDRARVNAMNDIRAGAQFYLNWLTNPVGAMWNKAQKETQYAAQEHANERDEARASERLGLASGARSRSPNR